MPKYGAQINTQRIPILGLVPEQHPVASAPASPVEGLFWHDTDNKVIKVYLNGAWSALGTAGAGGPPSGAAGGDLTGSTYPNPVIANNAVTAAKIAPGVIPTTLPPNGAAGGDLNGTYPSPGVVKGQSGFTAQAIAATALNPSAPAFTVRTPSAGDTQDKVSVSGSGIISFGSGAAAVDVNLYRDVADSLRTADKFTADLGLVSGAQIDATNHKVVNVTDPTAAQDAATKAYVDAVVQGLDVKASVRAATAVNIGDMNDIGSSIDGVAMVTGDRVLVKNQTTAANNGIYVCGGPSPSLKLTRTGDQDTWAEVPGAFTFVEEGTVNADTGWVCTANAGGTLGTTVIPWSQFSGAGSITAGAGLTKTGSTLDVGAGPGITVNADTVQIANDGVTNAMLADGAVNLASADVTGTLPVTKGGTGATDAFNAIKNLGGVTSAKGVTPVLSAGVWTNLTGPDMSLGGIHISFIESSSPYQETLLDVRQHASVPETCQIKADVAYGAGALNWLATWKG